MGKFSPIPPDLLASSNAAGEGGLGQRCPMQVPGGPRVACMVQLREKACTQRLHAPGKECQHWVQCTPPTTAASAKQFFVQCAPHVSAACQKVHDGEDEHLCPHLRILCAVEIQRKRQHWFIGGLCCRMVCETRWPFSGCELLLELRLVDEVLVQQLMRRQHLQVHGGPLLQFGVKARHRERIKVEVAQSCCAVEVSLVVPAGGARS
eukprot:16443996-Heterocapsa_arctica.AAC.1